MRTLDEIKQAVHESSELSKQGENAEALELLDKQIKQTVESNDSRAGRMFCRHASVIAEFSGNLEQVKRYREMLAEAEAEGQ